MNLAIIPARGGSKRIPRKNIKPFCGKPMITWSIEAAKASGCFDRIIVSTDDEEIADVARQWGAEVPFMRPTELADDNTATRPVVNHAIREAERLWGNIEYVCCIYATAPFIQVHDLKQGFNRLLETGADFAFSVTSFPYPIQRALKRTAEGGVEMFYPQYHLSRSQDLEPAYHDAGQFYWGRSATFLSGKDMYSPTALPILLPHHRVQDIDTLEDWQRAELLMGALFGHGLMP